MSTEFKLPELGEGVETAEIAEIHVKEGDEIAADQIVMELETDKAVVELPSPYAGKVGKIHVASGETVKVGQVLISIEGATAKTKGKAKAPEQAGKQPAETTQKSAAADEASSAASKAAPQKQTESAKREAAEKEPRKEPAPSPANRESAGESRKGNGQTRHPVAAGPATRRLAHVLNIALDRLRGSGPRGRITLEDVVRAHESTVAAPAGHLAAPPLPDFSKDGEIETVALNKIARTTIENLTRSWQLIPHVTQQGDADVTELESVRRDYNQRAGESAAKITLTAIAVKACVACLKEFPRFNSSVDLENHVLIYKKYYHIGIAVDTEHGLVVPVIRDADRKHIADIANEIDDLATRARDRKLDVKEMQGATFTISNQGSIGGTAFTPIVNWPQVAILGLSRSTKQMVVINDQPQIRLIAPLSLSYDHRAINGAHAARFIVRLGEILSDSRKLLFET